VNNSESNNRRYDDMTELRRMREGMKISMTELALRADVGLSTLSLVERGKRPSRRTAERIAEALNVDPTGLWQDFDELRRY
jgi:transcriptional regulator with XRE-family HTH domain